MTKLLHQASLNALSPAFDAVAAAPANGSSARQLLMLMMKPHAPSAQVRHGMTGVEDAGQVRVSTSAHWGVSVRHVGENADARVVHENIEAAKAA